MLKAVRLAVIMVSLFLVGCSDPPEKIARDVIAASKGAITTAQLQYKDACGANPRQDVCTQINQAIDTQHLAIVSLKTYCQFTDVSLPDEKCVPMKEALPALRVAVANLNSVTIAIQALVNGGK